MKNREARTLKPVTYSALALALAATSFLAGRAVRPRDVSICDRASAEGDVNDGSNAGWRAEDLPAVTPPAPSRWRRAPEPLPSLPVIPPPPPVAGGDPGDRPPGPSVQAPAVDVTAKNISDPAVHARMISERTREVETRIASSGATTGAPADWQLAASALRETLRRSVADNSGLEISDLRCFRDGCMFSLVGPDRTARGRTRYLMAELLALSTPRLPGGGFIGAPVTGADGRTDETIVLFGPGVGSDPAAAAAGADGRY